VKFIIEQTVQSVLCHDWPHHVRCLYHF